MGDLEVFNGHWTVEVLSHQSSLSARFTIVSSDNADADYEGLPGVGPIAVSGAAWGIRAQWNDGAGSDWRPSDLKRLSVTYTLADGLVVLVGADDNYDNLRDFDFDDLVLRCQSDDPRFVPWRPLTRPYDFTIPEDVYKRRRRRRRDGRATSA
jgi:hypothetical protein